MLTADGTLADPLRESVRGDSGRTAESTAVATLGGKLETPKETESGRVMGCSQDWIQFMAVPESLPWAHSEYRPDAFRQGAPSFPTFFSLWKGSSHRSVTELGCERRSQSTRRGIGFRPKTSRFQRRGCQVCIVPPTCFRSLFARRYASNYSVGSGTRSGS